MGERVCIRDGSLPIIIVAPHGVDDPYTDIIAESIADRLDCHAVINCGWERADKVDVDNDKANCNSIAHCNEDVVKDEFLNPILRYVNRSVKTINNNSARNGLGGHNLFCNVPLMITIHGAGDQARTLAKSTKLDFILGVGNGNPPRVTLPIWKKNVLAWKLMDKGVHVWEGKSGGGYAAWGKDNLNQLVGKLNANSLQIEIVRKPWRESETRSFVTGIVIADAIKEILQMSDFSKFKVDMGISQI
jgi:hypothetical protein